jgi:hypothetical protein
LKSKLNYETSGNTLSSFGKITLFFFLEWWFDPLPGLPPFDEHEQGKENIIFFMKLRFHTQLYISPPPIALSHWAR